MAISSTFICDSCHESKSVLHGSNEPQPTTCTECKEKKAAEAKSTELARLAALPTLDRIALIESYIYDHKLTFHPSKGWRG